MKFTFATTALALALSAVTPALALPEPVPATPEPTVYSGSAVELERRANSGTVVVDGLRYRTCPRTSCTAVGQYSKGTKISITCYTRENTTIVNGDAGWGKLTNGYWVALANGSYVTWTGAIPYCS